MSASVAAPTQPTSSAATRHRAEDWLRRGDERRTVLADVPSIGDDAAEPEVEPQAKDDRHGGSRRRRGPMRVLAGGAAASRSDGKTGTARRAKGIQVAPTMASAMRCTVAAER